MVYDEAGAVYSVGQAVDTQDIAIPSRLHGQRFFLTFVGTDPQASGDVRLSIH